MIKARADRFALLWVLIAAAPAVLLIGASDAADAPERFFRNYAVRRAPHLSIGSAYGDITVTAWTRKEVSVRAAGPPSVLIHDSVIGNVITVFVMRAPRMGKVDFDVAVPPDTSLHLKNRKGNVNVSGVAGHIEVDSGDGEIRFSHAPSSSIEARVVSGDIFFDGDLTGDGPYTFQSVKGYVDITLPAWNSFRLSAQAMSGQINIGEFTLNSIKRNRRSISGVHVRGGPALNLVTYEGRILLHRR